MVVAEEKDELKGKLKEIFGYSNFRGNQEVVIKNILGGRNTFVIMPTGAGKSLCYQLPAMVSEGLAIVISPLIALMKNQVDQLNAYGINARFLNSTLSKGEITRIRKDCVTGKIKLLYVAPESLIKEENIEFLQKVKIAFVAIDEAHCISEWGHDFRPEYRKIKSMIAQLGDMNVIALTATATPKVQLDIQKNLQMEEADVFISSFNRKNLYYEVRPKKETKKQLIRFLKDHKGKSGIIYCLSRKKVEEIAQLLNVNGFKAAPYHAGLDSDVRMKNQDDFLNEEVDIICATIAFGMGIDKPDVRFVVHYDVPKSLEGYYQETGRAGRDGLEGLCLMFYSHNDLNKLEKFNKDKSVQERENARILLQEMEFYAESPVCRRKQLLHYFGEEYQGSNCGMCDNCTNPRERFEGSEFVKIALEAVKQTNERFGLAHLVNVIRGIEDEYVKSYGHFDLKVYGQGDTEDADFWKSVIRQALIYQYLEKDIENIGVLKLSQKGIAFLKKPHPIELARDHDFTTDIEEEESSERTPINSKSYDDKLFEMLKALRKKIAKEKDLPPYVIFQDPSLEEMATTYPTTKEEMAGVNGVGMGKVNKFGKEFLELIQKYVDDNDIETAADVVVKSSVNKSKIKIFIIQQIDRKVDLEEIAESKALSFDELLTEMENIINSGTKLNVDYYIDEVLDESKQEEIYDYFLSSETDSVQDALAELSSYSEEDVRLMRMKFLSEYAN
ncbi:MAG: ATP-dependent DNA helicase RecQ [Cytophagales bacterium]|jgi:ATP-dependent DNA helicase RecQ|nr:DNA helicase RecQ [Bacteroidota bacterium]MBS1982342.1 DNA helicase RecQ [Bacteroidota bacterium]WHZ07557.1 MAG: ATP-dependent DNA helicase RecQ [Cytophagales bacterium]